MANIMKYYAYFMIFGIICHFSIQFSQLALLLGTVIQMMLGGRGDAAVDVGAGGWVCLPQQERLQTVWVWGTAGYTSFKQH